MQAELKPTAFLDLDGPIVDVSFRHYHVYSDGVRALGGTPIAAPDFWESKRRMIPDREILRRSELGESAEAYDAIKMKAIESSRYLSFDRLQPGALEALRQIHRRYDIVVVTLRHSREELVRQLALFGVSDFLSNVLSSGPNKKAGWETKVGLVREAGLVAKIGDFFAGDTATDILAGRALGIFTVAVCDGIRDEAFLRKLAPDYIIPSLVALSATNLLQ